MTVDQVWAALEEIPDPEIPVISLVDLGVVKRVEVEGESVRIDFTPTFMGCPALDTMRLAMEAKVAELGARAAVNVRLDDSWSTDDITSEGREKLRAAVKAGKLTKKEAKAKLAEFKKARAGSK